MNSAADKPDALGKTEKLARLRLIRSENVGPVTFFRLLERFGTAAKALDALPDLARKGGRKRTLKVCPQTKAEAEMEDLLRLGVTALHRGDVGYPPLLAHVEDAPPILFVRGHLHLLGKKAVAIVGARNASLNGRRFAADMATALGDAGYLVVSGMARGIDTAAHQGAMASGTVAVLGGGVDVVYPRENQDVYDGLMAMGTLCSEVPCGTTPQSRHFPRRNRIISGIARAVVVIEAGAKSGSLITARTALEQGREVFAVPGPPQDPRVKGTNALIRDGACLTESAADVLAGLHETNARVLREGRRRVDLRPPPIQVAESAIDGIREDILQALGYGPTDVDDIIRTTVGHTGAVAVVLLELELAGRLERLPGNKVALLE